MQSVCSVMFFFLIAPIVCFACTIQSMTLPKPTNKMEALISL